MADETNPGSLPETAEPTTTAAVKKTRAPRRSKAEMEADAAAKKGRSKTGSAASRKAVEPASAAVSADASAKSKRTSAGSLTKPANATLATKTTAQPVASAAAEMVELLRLEEENKQLRNSLAEKLRAENADLRKRLGNL